MKKILFLFACLAALSACAPQAKQPVEAPSGPEEGQANGQQAIAECLDVCGAIQSVCRGEITEFKDSGQNIEDTVYSEDGCFFICEAEEWGPETKDCISDAEECEQILNAAPYCIDTSKEDSGPEITEQGAADCRKACLKYKDCAGYTEGAGPQDQEDAYNSCMQECVHWSAPTRSCINSKTISKPSDCLVMTQCALREYQGTISR